MVKLDSALPWSDYDDYVKDKSMEKAFRCWLDWVKRTQPEVEQVLSRKVIGMKGEQAAQCSAQSVAAHFDALEKLFKDIGVLSETDSSLRNPHRVWAVDEKAMVDDGGKLKFVRGLSVKGLGAPTCSAGASSFRRISVLPFVCLDGQVSEPYITVSGNSEMNAWSSVWPHAHIKATERLGPGLIRLVAATPKAWQILSIAISYTYKDFIGVVQVLCAQIIFYHCYDHLQI